MRRIGLGPYLRQSSMFSNGQPHLQSNQHLPQPLTSPPLWFNNIIMSPLSTSSDSSGLDTKVENTSSPVVDYPSFVTQLIDEQQDRFAHHPLFNWLTDKEGPHLRRKLAGISVGMIEPVMNSLDLYKYFIRYNTDFRERNTVFHQLINQQAFEHGKFPHLFLNDLDLLAVPVLLGWECNHYMKFVLCTDDKAIKQQQLRLYKLALDANHPLVKFPLMSTLKTAELQLLRKTAALTPELPLADRYHYFASGPSQERISEEYARKFFGSVTSHHDMGRIRQLYGGIDDCDSSLLNNVESVVRETGEIMMKTFDDYLRLAQKLNSHKESWQSFFSFSTPAEQTRSRYQIAHNTPPEKQTHSYNKLMTTPSLFSCSNPVLLEKYLNKEAKGAYNHILNHLIYAKLSSREQLARILYPFGLIDGLSLAHFSRFNNWDHQVYNNSHLLELCSEKIGKLLGDSLTHDWDKLDFSNYARDYAFPVSLSFRFFGDRSDQHRKHFSDWRKYMLNATDPAIQCMILYNTAGMIQLIAKCFLNCIENERQTGLLFFSGVWYEKFNQEVGKDIHRLETSLTIEQKYEIYKVTSKFMSQLEERLNLAMAMLPDEDPHHTLTL